MSKHHDILGAWLEGDAFLRERFAYAPDDWSAAWNAARARTWRPWCDDDFEELRAFNIDNEAPGETLDNLEKLANPDARVVVTGQQAGLAMGPLYTLYKALGAIRLARRLEREQGRPVVPVFWIAAEDHDFEEVREVSWLTKDGERETFRYEPEADIEQMSVGWIPVENSLRALIERVRDSTAPTDFRDGALDWLRESIDGSVDLEGMFARALLHMLGRFGLVAVTPRLLGLRRHAANLFRRELDAPGLSAQLVIQAAERLRKHGFEPSLHRDPSDLNFFFYEDSLRWKLIWNGKEIELQGKEGTLRAAAPDELLDSVRSDPTRISTNVVSRPVTQDRALPTVAYVAGPGEVAYFAQLKEVYERWETPMPLIAPRPRALLVDAYAARFFENMDATIEDFLRDSPGEFERRVMAETDAAEEWKAVEAARDSMNAAVEQLRAAIGDVAPSVGKAIDKLEGGCQKGLKSIEGRLGHEMKQRNQVQTRRLERVETWLRPGGGEQERVYSAIAPLLVNYGFESLSRLLDDLDPDRRDLQILNL